MISDWYACTYKEVTNDKGKVGSNAVEGMLKPIYTRKLMKKTLKSNKSLKGFKDITKKGDIITRKNAVRKFATQLDSADRGMISMGISKPETLRSSF